MGLGCRAMDDQFMRPIYKIAQGMSVTDAARMLIDESSQNGRHVAQGEFNGVLLVAFPHSTVENVVKPYWDIQKVREDAANQGREKMRIDAERYQFFRRKICDELHYDVNEFDAVIDAQISKKSKNQE